MTRAAAGLRPSPRDVRHALEVFVRGFSFEKSRTHPYEYHRVGKLWRLRDAERKNSKQYRKEEWIAYQVPPRDVDQAARTGTRGWFFICALCGPGEDQANLRDEYKSLGYRLLTTETLFIHRLQKFSQGPLHRLTSSGMKIEQVKTPALAQQLAKATRSRPIPSEQLARSAPFRQYVAIDGSALVGWVRSVNAGDSTWCSTMYVRPTHRRRGIGRALLTRMLLDDRRRGSRKSVLLSSHAGALLYPHVGYEPLGTLLILAPRKRYRPFD
jgi:GNAT superfamily N-acetyltransferase